MSLTEHAAPGRGFLDDEALRGVPNTNPRADRETAAWHAPLTAPTTSREVRIVAVGVSGAAGLRIRGRGTQVWLLTAARGGTSQDPLAIAHTVSRAIRSPEILLRHQSHCHLPTARRRSGIRWRLLRVGGVPLPTQLQTDSWVKVGDQCQRIVKSTRPQVRKQDMKRGEYMSPV
jgi:hypothetical protein